MHATARRPLWVRVGAGLLATVLFLTNTVYPWISLLPAPPIVVAQESPLIASDSAEATPAASVATPAPSPLDPLDQLENEILLSTNSAETVPPEEPPESSPSASSAKTPEPSPEDQASAPSGTPSPNLGSLDLPASLPSPSPSPSPDLQDSLDLPGLLNSPLPPPLDPFLISLKYPFVGNYPISYGFGEESGSSYVRLMQSIFDVDAHDGLDFAMPEGTSILATGIGEVTYAGNGLYGVTVIIRHSWGNSYYGHLSLTSVTVGDKVTTGQEIGLSGNTGISTAPHLHFGIRPNHYDPYNGYRGMIDPLPYLTGTVLGTSTKHDLIHLPYKTLDASDPSLSIPVIASSSAGLTYTLKNPRGESKLVYPSIYNYGTGDTAILPRPTPFIPGEYTLTVTNQLGESDIIKFSWGVLTLNTNQSRYQLGQTAKLALAVLDEVGEMVCDADLTLNVTSPTGAVETLTTDNTLITRNIAVCQSKDLTLTPDYEATFTPSEVGTHNITLTAITPKHTFTMTDSFEVVDTLPYTLERLTTTRIFPGNVYPVILKVTAHQDLDSQLVEQVPIGFSTTPAGSTDFAPWVSPDDLATIHPGPYTRTENSSSQSLSWDLDLKTNQSVILGYTYDAPDESPALYSLGPISYAGATEARSWNLAIDGVDPTVGAFAPQTGVAWTSAGDANLNLRQPSPKNGDLMIATIAIRPSASTVDTPSGWTLVDSQTGTDGGAEGADTGSVGLYWFSKVADGTEGTANQTFTETGTTSVWIGQIIKFRSSTGTYDLSSGGYSLNADATNWNGTLDTDIGTKDGDLILIAGAQNGDLSNTSAWNIAATNLTTKSTVNEYFEGTTTTGNDVEVGIAETHIWEGNNTTTPTITLTQSVAASGAVMALRIRQGSGTNRTDTWVRSSGPFAVGTTSVAPAYPDLDIGDMLILVVGSRGTTDPTPTTPTGWTLIGSSYNGGAGAFAADAGNARITTYSREATSRLTGTQSVTITSGNTAHGQIYAINRDNAEGWTISSGGGTDTTAGTGYSVTTSSVSLDSASGGDVVLIASSINTDAYTYTSLSLTQTGSTITTPNEEAEYRGTTGNDMGLHVASTEVTSGSGSGAATFSMTGSGSTASAPAGATIAIKILGTAQTVASKAVGFFTPPATWTSAGNANLSLTYPDPRNGDLMVAVTAIRPAASTVDTPAGWTLVDSRTGTDGGAEGADTGSVGIYVFTKTSDGTEGTGTLAFTETGTTSVWIGNIMKVRSGTGTYSVSASGYSLNGDTVTWGSTLGSDIGLTNGDLVLLASAQNGDLSNTSAWDISATGVTQKSTFNEHGEFGSTTGNDIEVGLASGMIWGGTNSATPTLTLTQSAAASGVVSAIRIREDTGTQRTDTWVRSSSAQVVSTTTTLSLVYPEHEVGDMFVMFVSTRGTSDPTLLAPQGWTSLGSYNGGAGTFGVDAGNARTTAYYREATSRRWGTQAVALTSADVAIGQILSVHTKNIDTWSIDSDGGTDTSAGTGWSVTGSGIDFSSTEGGDVILVGSAINTDAYTYTSHALSASGITFGEVTQTATYNTSSGNDSNLTVLTSRVTAGSGSNVAPTTTMTASGSTANAPAGSSLFVKIVGIPTVMAISGTANGNNGATVKVALGASVQAQTTTISSGTWTISDVTRPSIGAVVTVWVDGVADNLETTAVTLYNSAPVSGLVLNTNVLTLGSNQNQSLSLTNLNTYDCTEDEDIMHQAASSHLKVEGDACFGSTTNTYTSEKLAVLTGDTLALGTSETITTYDLENAGTITVTGNGTLNVSHDWANTGTFTAGTSTVNLTGGDSTTQTISGNSSFYNLSATTTSNSAGRTIRYTAGTTSTVTGTWTMNGASSKILTLESSSSSIWSINPTLISASYLTVSYSHNIGARFCPQNSTDGGNNLDWYLPCSPTDHTFQRKTWHDGTRFWRSYYDPTDNRVEFEYSATGASWTENTSARLTLPTPDFSIEADSTNLIIAYTTGTDIGGRLASSYPGTNFGWGSENVIFNGTTQGSNSYRYPSLARDSSSYIWVSATYSGSGVYYTKTIKETSATNDLPEDSGDTVYTLADTSNTNPNVFASLSPLTSQNMYLTFTYGTALQGCRWVNASTDWQNSSNTSCTLTVTTPTQVSSSTDTTTTSSTYTGMSGMTTTPGSGDYFVSFSTSIQKSTGTSDQYVSLFVGGSQVTHTERFLEQEASYDTGDIYVVPVTIQAYVSGVGVSDAIEVQWKTSSGTATAKERSMIVTRVTPSNISQATATATSTTTSATDTQVNSMTLTPGAGDYMVYFSASAENTASSHTYFSIYAASSQVAHSERDLYTEESYPDTSYPVSTHAYISGVGASDTIEVRWRTDAGTATINQRTLTLQKVTAADITQLTSTSSTTTTSATDTQLTTMTSTPGAGDYLVYFSTSLRNSVSDTTQNLSLYNAGSQITHTERQILTENSHDVGVNDNFVVSTQAYITSVGASDTVEIRWRTTSGTSTVVQRTLTFIKLNTTVGTSDAIATIPTSSPKTFISSSDSSGNLHLAYINSSNQTIYRERTSTWQTAVTLDSNTSNSYPTISLNTNNNDLYVFWIRADDIFYKKGVSPYASGDWDASATSWKSTNTNTSVIASTSGNDKVYAEWFDGTNIQWDQLSLGASNTAPNSPTSLTQKTTGDVTLSTGVWHNSTSIKFTATATDTDNPDTLQLCVEIDQLGTSFSNTEDSCGTGGSYVGSGITITHTITVADAQEYHWQARVKDLGGLYSSWVSYDANAESARDIGVDTTAPTGGTVYDGTGVGVDSTFATSSLSALSANWASFNNNVSGLLRYDYSIGTTAGATDVKAWTDNTTSTSVTATGLTLQTSQMYFFNVRAVDNAGNIQSAVSSNGQLISPSISFAITPASATFSNLNATNSYTDTEVATLTTSTNAYNGYVIRAFTTDLLKSVGGTHQIANFSTGSYASPATWAGSETGFGYTSSDTTIQGSNKFSSGTLFAPFTQTGPGDIVADHTSNVTGTSISNESFNITYKVKVPSDQAATNYTSTVVYTATAQY